MRSDTYGCQRGGEFGEVGMRDFLPLCRSKERVDSKKLGPLLSAVSLVSFISL